MLKAGSLGTKTMRIGELIKRCIIAYLIPRFYLLYRYLAISKLEQSAPFSNADMLTENLLFCQLLVSCGV